MDTTRGDRWPTRTEFDDAVARQGAGTIEETVSSMIRVPENRAARRAREKTLKRSASHAISPSVQAELGRLRGVVQALTQQRDALASRVEAYAGSLAGMVSTARALHAALDEASLELSPTPGTRAMLERVVDLHRGMVLALVYPASLTDRERALLGSGPSTATPDGGEAAEG